MLCHGCGHFVLVIVFGGRIRGGRVVEVSPWNHHDERQAQVCMPGQESKGDSEEPLSGRQGVWESSEEQEDQRGCSSVREETGAMERADG